VGELLRRHWGGLLALVLGLGAVVLDRLGRLEKPGEARPWTRW
jgi:hypothetical protein